MLRINLLIVTFLSKRERPEREGSLFSQELGGLHHCSRCQNCVFMGLDRSVCFYFAQQAEMGFVARRQGVWGSGEQGERVDLGCSAQPPPAAGAAGRLTWASSR